jgi:septum formation protein
LIPSEPTLVLASGSPRRAELLSLLGLRFTVDPAHLAEDLLPEESAEAHVERLAREKALTVAQRNPGSLVVAGDTVVVLEGKLLGKPEGEEEAMSMLRSLSGHTHTVASGVAVAGGRSGIHSAVETTRVTFRAFREQEAREYVATGEPLDKAGGYGIQGLGASLVARIDGDFYTVVGLPLARLVELLERAGWHYRFGVLRPSEPSSGPGGTE